MCTPRFPPSSLPFAPSANRGTNNQKFCGFNWIWAMPQNRFARVGKWAKSREPGGCWQLEKVEFAFEQSWGNKINCNQVKRHSTRHEGQPDRRLDLKPDCQLNWECDWDWDSDWQMGMGGIGFHYWAWADSVSCKLAKLPTFNAFFFFFSAFLQHEEKRSQSTRLVRIDEPLQEF